MTDEKSTLKRFNKLMDLHPIWSDVIKSIDFRRREKSVDDVDDYEVVFIYRNLELDGSNFD